MLSGEPCASVSGYLVAATQVRHMPRLECQPLGNARSAMMQDQRDLIVSKLLGKTAHLDQFRGKLSSDTPQAMQDVEANSEQQHGDRLVRGTEDYGYRH